MSYLPDMAVLRGMSAETADCFGKPSVGAYYAGKGVRTNRLDEDARCAVCGARARNSHHQPPTGMGGGRSSYLLHGHGMRPALIALCGSGTTGCHGKVHSGALRIRWEWDEEGMREAWFEGRFPPEFYDGNNRQLFGFGRWVVTDREGNEIREIREI